MFIQVLLTVFTVINFWADIDPVREYSMTPESFELEYRQQFIVTPDSAKINTWYMQSDVDRKRIVTFIIAGSDAGNMGYTLPYAFHLLRLGFDVVTFDYRGFGNSSDFDHNPNYLYHPEYITDFVTVAEWVKEELHSEKVGVLAFSMGTLVASAGYAHCAYDFLVAEGMITSPEVVARRIEAEKGVSIALPPNSSLDLPTLIDQIDIPMIVYASTQDSITTLADSESITADRDERILVAYDGPHLRGMVTLGVENYLHHLNNLFE